MLKGAVEAVALGLASGPVCLASCGPVLLPWLAVEREGTHAMARLLSLFLGGRLAGYLLFAALAWAAGQAVPVGDASRALVFGIANLILAATLGLYAWAPWKACPAGRGRNQDSLQQIQSEVKSRPPATFLLGFLTGLSLCPPFIAAGVRAAETRSLSGALLFFLLFFAGTAVWFLPAVAISPLRRIPAAAAVARIILGLIAIYYAYLGIISLSWRLLHA